MKFHDLLPGLFAGTVGLLATLLFCSCEDPASRRNTGEAGDEEGGGGLIGMGLVDSSPNAPAINPKKSKHQSPYKEVDALSSGMRFVCLANMQLERGGSEKLCLVSIDASNPTTEFNPRVLTDRISRDANFPQPIAIPESSEFLLIIDGAIHRIAADGLESSVTTKLENFHEDIAKLTDGTRRDYVQPFGLVGGTKLMFGVYDGRVRNELQVFEWEIAEDPKSTVTKGSHKQEKGILYAGNFTSPVGLITAHGPKRLPFRIENAAAANAIKRDSDIVFDPERGWLFSLANIASNRGSRRANSTIYHFIEPGPEDLDPNPTAISEGFNARFLKGNEVAFITNDLAISKVSQEGGSATELFVPDNEQASLRIEDGAIPLSVSPDGNLLAYGFRSRDRGANEDSNYTILMDVEAEEIVVIRGFAAMTGAWVGK